MNFKNLKNKKGITPIISVILLLMMTIAIAGLAYSWLQKMQSSITVSTENRTAELLGGLNIELKVDGYYLNCTTGSNLTTFYVRNAGSDAATNLRIYIDDQFFENGTSGTNSSIVTIEAGHSKNFAINASRGCEFFNNSARTVKVVSDQTTTEKAFTFRCSEGACLG
ncbi:MAG: archaellin/type IV pilin N-terminal domain-containing protein [archaeon]